MDAAGIGSVVHCERLDICGDWCEATMSLTRYDVWLSGVGRRMNYSFSDIGKSERQQLAPSVSAPM